MRRALLFSLLGVGCAHTPAPAPAPVEAPKPPAVVVAAPWYGDVHALAVQAAKLRGLTLTQTFEVVALDDDAFAAQEAALAEKKGQSLQLDLELSLGELLGVDLEKLKASAQERAPSEPVGSEAFYDSTSHRLFLRAHSELAKASERERTLVLAHEIGHVLQDQLGAALRVPTSLDEAVARKAVLEGDASLTAVLVDAERNGVPLRRAVERVRLDSGEATALSMGQTPTSAQVSPLMRELLTFSYVRGLRFVADLYAAGGLELETKVLVNPPTRTDALFATQRWLGGRVPPLQPLQDPPRRLGAFALHTMVQKCMGRMKDAARTVRWFDAHYVDDSFRRAGNTLSYAIAWDFTPAPELGEDANARSISAAFAPELSAGLLKCMGVAPDNLAVTTTNGVVGLVVGAPGADRARLSKAVSRQGRQEPAAPRPFVIPDPRTDVAYRVPGPGVLNGDTWSHAKLGLTVNVSDGRVMNTEESTLMVMADGSVFFLAFVDEPPTPASEEGFVRTFMSSWLHHPDVAPETSPLVWTKAPLTWANARETRGEYEGPTAVHALVVPICNGKASLNLVTLGMSPTGQKRAEAWLESVKGTTNPPMCSEAP